MDVKLRHVILTFGGLSLTGTIASAGCKIKGSTITTKELSGTSLKNTMEVEYKPETGTVFANVTLEGCTAPELNKTYPVEGTAKGIGDGATVETTTGSTASLSLGGQAATFTSKLTPRLVVSSPSGQPLASATVIDP